jgi:TM2 domain-containing membrane protein YozV
MYCPRCGSQIPDGSKFCPSCGNNLEGTPPPVYPGVPSYGQPVPQPNPAAYYQRKSEGIALILAILLPGVGHIYAGKVTKGIILLVAFYGLAAVIGLAWALSFGWGYYDMMNTNFVWPSGLLVFTVIASLVMAILWIYQIVDAYTTTNKYNAELMATGRAPW